jgi:uncharacterized membrane protein
MSVLGVHAERGSDDHALNRTVSTVLVVGIAVSVGLMILGLLLAAIRGEDPRTALAVTKIPGGLAHGDAGGLMSAGVVALLLTPALRVVVLLAAYVGRRQWLFAVLSATVLGVMVVSVVLGLQ